MRPQWRSSILTEEDVKEIERHLLLSSTCKSKDQEKYLQYRDRALTMTVGDVTHGSSPVEHGRQCFMDAIYYGGISTDFTGRLQHVLRTRVSPMFKGYQIKASDMVDLTHEAVVGFLMGNRMREWNPTFAYTYAYFPCGYTGAPITRCQYPSPDGGINFLMVEDLTDTRTLAESHDTFSYKDYLMLLVQIHSALHMAGASCGLIYLGGSNAIRIWSPKDGILIPIYSTSLRGYVKVNKVPIFSIYSDTAMTVDAAGESVALGPRGKDWISDIEELLQYITSLLDIVERPNIRTLIVAAAGHLSGTSGDFLEWILSYFTSVDRQLQKEEVIYRGTQEPTTGTPSLLLPSPHGDVPIPAPVDAYADVKLEILMQITKMDEEVAAIADIIEEELPDDDYTDDFLEESLRKFSAGVYGKSTAHLLAAVIYSAIHDGIPPPIGALGVQPFREFIDNFVVAYGRVWRFTDVVSKIFMKYKANQDIGWNMLKVQFEEWRDHYSSIYSEEKVLDFLAHVADIAMEAFPKHKKDVDEIMQHLGWALVARKG